MRVLFIQTPSVEGLSAERVYPIGMVLLAGRLQQAGHDVRLVDMNMEPDPYGAVKIALLEFAPEVVGLSLRNIDPLANRTASLVPPFLVTAKLVAALQPKAWLLAGGTGFSLFPERLMREAPEIHFGMVGEGETVLPQLLAALPHPPALPGLCRRVGERIQCEPPAGTVSMHAYEPPRREILDPASYARINSYVPAIGIEAKRGCLYRCAYCVYPQLQGCQVRCRPPVAVVDEIEQLQDTYGVDRIHFTDSVVNAPAAQLEAICRELIRRNLRVRWSGFFREDAFTAAAASLYEEAGCECFSFSPDGLYQEALDLLDKQLTEEKILQAATAAAATNVISVYHFMVNLPGETAATVERSQRFLERIYALHESRRNLGTIVLNNVRILPNTPMEALARKAGIITPETDLLYPTYCNPKPFETLRYRLETLHLRHNVFQWQGVN